MRRLLAAVTTATTVRGGMGILTHPRSDLPEVPEGPRDSRHGGNSNSITLMDDVVGVWRSTSSIEAT